MGVFFLNHIALLFVSVTIKITVSELLLRQKMLDVSAVIDIGHVCPFF